MEEMDTKGNLTAAENVENKSHQRVKMKKSYLIIKRMLDILGSSIGMILLSPVYLIIIILVKLDSKGPAMFAHKRIGMNGQVIKVYKFRTMVTNAEEILRNLPEEKKREFEINFKFDDDPRITRIGKILRETSLDELPQLFNILIGNMSIVGPRPIVTAELKKYGVYADKLLSAKPGLAGYWQANGRSDTTYEERVAMDMYYIDNASIWMDIKVIFQTLISVFKKEGAR